MESILITTGVHLSSDVLELANSQNIDVVFLNKFGDPYARVWQAKMGSTAAIRRRQIEIAEGAEGLTLVLDWCQAKVTKPGRIPRRAADRAPESALLFDQPLISVHNSLAQMQELTGSLEEKRGTLMGLEGSAARAYFGCLSQLMPEAYRFPGRSRHPAHDPFNAMLNYSYGVLYSLVEKACICAGLYLFVGFLHTDNYNKKSLVYDLIEPFRIMGERTTVLLFTGRRVQKSFFGEVPGGMAPSRMAEPRSLLNSTNGWTRRCVIRCKATHARPGT